GLRLRRAHRRAHVVARNGDDVRPRQTREPSEGASDATPGMAEIAPETDDGKACHRILGLRGLRSIGALRLRRPLAAAASRSAALALRPLFGSQHAFAFGRIGLLEALPPVSDLDRYLSAVPAQPQEVVARAEARMLEQPERALARALLEPRLHRPGFLDHRFEAARNRKPRCLLLEDAIHRREQRRNRPLALRLGGVPGREDL